jgi:hypothetical protein
VERATRHLELSIDINSDPITGSISGGAQDALPFSGWIELVAAIEAARSPAEAAAESLGSLPGAKATALYLATDIA